MVVAGEGKVNTLHEMILLSHQRVMSLMDCGGEL